LKYRGFPGGPGATSACRAIPVLLSLPRRMASNFPFFNGPSSKKEVTSRVLLIDDEWEAHDIFHRILRRSGANLQFDSAFGGEEGIGFMERCSDGTRPWPYLVFIDIKMPGATGFDVLEWANNRGVLGNAVFVMLSSSNEPRDVMRSFQLGAHHYVSKTSPPEVLRELLRGAMRFAREDSIKPPPLNSPRRGGSTPPPSP
jgi:CheY-like chemotaxis protein